MQSAALERASQQQLKEPLPVRVNRKELEARLRAWLKKRQQELQAKRNHKRK